MNTLYMSYTGPPATKNNIIEAGDPMAWDELD